MGTKLAEWFLVLACILYLPIGLFAIGASYPPATRIPMLTPIFAFSEIALFETFIGLVPGNLIRLLFNPSVIENSGPLLSPLATSLGTGTIILSILGLIAIFRYRYSSGWLLVWYLISALSIIVAAANFFGPLTYNSRYLVQIIGGSVYAVLVILSTFALHRKKFSLNEAAAQAKM